MAEITPEARAQAIRDLEAILATLEGMSEWIDGDSSDRQRAAIMLEDAANLVRGAGWVIERLDPARVAMLAHRRMVTSPDRRF
jgi:hypothetical protein